MIPFKFNVGGPQKGPQPATGPTGIQKFFTPAPAGGQPAADPATLAAGMGGGEGGADPASPKLVADTPFASDYAEGLISTAMKPQTSGSGLEAAGRFAQLVSGHYHKSKDDARENERAAATLEILKKSDPETAAVFAAADSKTRKAIMGQVVGDRMASKREERAEQRAVARDDRQHQRAIELQDRQNKLETERADAQAQRQIDIARKKDEADYEAKKQKYRAAYPQASDEDIAKMAAGLTPKTVVEKGHIIRTDPFGNVIGVQKVGAVGPSGRVEPERDPQTGAPVVPGVRPEVAATFDPTNYRNIADTIKDPDSPMGKAMAEEAAKAHHKRSAELRTQFEAAGKMEQTLQAMSAALQNAPQGGPLATPLGMARQLANQLGILPQEQIAKMNAQEIVEALNTRLAPLAKDGLPGAVSNFEMDLFKRAMPGMLTSKEGAQQLMEVYNWMAARTKARQALQQEWMALRGAHGLDGSFGEGFEKFSEDRMKQIAKEMPPPAFMAAAAEAAKGSGPGGRKTRAELLEEQRARDEAPAPGGPKPGDVVNGYRFKGGNPNDRKNWESP